MAKKNIKKSAHPLDKCPMCGNRLATQKITEGVLAPRYSVGKYCPKCGWGRNNF